uniref:Uncharacterized protein n=1 Tax=Solanum tuberosum TaxID=4113 RepID=M1DXJ1_SOLTU
MIPNSGQLSEAMAFFSSNKGYPTSSGSGSTSVSNYRSQKPQNNSNLYCDYCNRKGHTRAICFRLHGYPANWRSKKRTSLALPLQPTLPESSPLMVASWSTQTSLVKVALLVTVLAGLS